MRSSEARLLSVYLLELDDNVVQVFLCQLFIVKPKEQSKCELLWFTFTSQVKSAV